MLCDRALQYIAVARQEGTGEIYSCFIAFKICLTKKDAAAACNELSSLVSCPEFSPDFLSVSLKSNTFSESNFHDLICHVLKALSP